MKSRSDSAAGPLVGLALLVLALSVPDTLTHFEVPLSLCYALATLMAGYYSRAAGAVLIGLWACAVHASSNVVNQLSLESRLLEDAGNFALWGLAGLVGARLRANFDQLEQRRELLESAQAQMKTHMERARFVQERLYQNSLAAIPGLEVHWECKVAVELGGDFLYVWSEGRTLSFVIADVAGKGPSAALVGAVLRGLIDDAIRAGPGELLNRLNGQLAALLPDNMFVTCFACRLCLDSGQLAYANAGHECPLIGRPGQDEVRLLEPTGLPLAVEASFPIDEAVARLEVGDVLVAFTDGLTESSAGEERFVESEGLQAELRRSSALPLPELCQRFFGLSPDFAQGRYRDDAMVIAARRCPI